MHHDGDTHTDHHVALKSDTRRRPNEVRKTVMYWEDGHQYRLEAVARWSKHKGNQHAYFCTNGDLYRKTNGRGPWRMEACGRLDDLIVEHIPEWSDAVKFCLVGEAGPMHYIENTLYHARTIPKKQDVWHAFIEGTLVKRVEGWDERNAFQRTYGKGGGAVTYESVDDPMAKEADFNAARSVACWPEATEDQLQSRAALEAHLPVLLDEFRAVLERIGLGWFEPDQPHEE